MMALLFLDLEEKSVLKITSGKEKILVYLQQCPLYPPPITSFNSLPNDKILNWSKLKAFAADKLNVGKGKNAGYQHFLLFPLCFQNPSVSGSLKVGIVW